MMGILQALFIRSEDSRARGVWVILAVFALTACQAKQDQPDTSPATPPAVTENTDIDKTESPPAVKPTLKPQEVFWNALETLCDKSFGGQLTIGTEESDRDFGLATLTMHTKRCKRNAIDIGLSVDDDDSRTWMIRRTDDGLSLHHRHVDESGTPDATSGYGGFSNTEGTAVRQEFPADENTGTMIPAAATNVWAIEITPGKTFVYELQRIEQQRMFRVVFDLTEPLPR